MCGRINVSDHPGVQALLDFLDIPLYPSQFVPRFNIAPGAQLFSAYANQQAFEGVTMHWGMIPSWAKPGKFNRPLTNARAETIWEKPSFKNLVKTQRLIIPINGFYEWKRSNKTKIAYHIHGKEQPAIALGGIYQISKDGELQCCVVTTTANEKMSAVHDRMPVIIQPESISDWLLSSDVSQLNSLMSPYSNQVISIDPVSSYVNNAQNEGPQCLEETETFTLKNDD